MTRRLVLVRHAKAVQGGPSDAERELAPRGRADAAEIGRWLSAHDIVPDRVVVSPSARTRQTWMLAGGPAPDVDDRIYDNTVDGLLAVVRDTPAPIGTLVLVGHNPSMAALAHALDDTVPAEYPTSAIAVFTVDAEWAEVASARLAAFGVPRGQQ